VGGYGPNLIDRFVLYGAVTETTGETEIASI